LKPASGNENGRLLMGRALLHFNVMTVLQQWGWS